MHYVRKTALTFLITLTAFSTLIAGTPHFVCRCPNGQVKLFCTSLSVKTTGCCCANACCGSAEQDGKSTAGDRPKCCGTAKCCCAKAKGSETGGTGRSVSLQRNCCTRTLATPDVQSRPDGKASVGMSVDDISLPTADWSVCYSPSFPKREGTIWSADRGPPPADLITVLRRLLI
jgi:hypothetical protein